MRLTLTLCATFMLVLVGCAGNDRPQRGEYSGPMSRMIVEPIALVMVDFDVDGDRITTHDEFETASTDSFNRADQNGDGQLSRIELNAWLLSALGSEYPVPGRIAFDPNGNQSTDLNEFITVLESAFTRLDRDRNTALERSELVQVFEPQMRRGGMGGGRRPGGGMGGGGMPGGGRPPM